MSKVIVGHRKDEEIKKLYGDVDGLFDQASKMLELCILLLDEQDNEKALDIIEEDVNMDELHVDMIININNFILQEQPKARDLRIALGIYAMSYDLERIADYFKNFAKTIIKTNITEESQISLLKLLLDEIKVRLNDTRFAFDNSSHELAKNIARRDIEIDKIVKKINKEITLEFTKQLTDKEARDNRRVILVAKGFERLGDHIVNLCEQISYIEKGRIYNYS